MNEVKNRLYKLTDLNLFEEYYLNILDDMKSNFKVNYEYNDSNLKLAHEIWKSKFIHELNHKGIKIPDDYIVEDPNIDTLDNRFYVEVLSNFCLLFSYFDILEPSISEKLQSKNDKILQLTFIKYPNIFAALMISLDTLISLIEIKSVIPITEIEQNITPHNILIACKEIKSTPSKALTFYSFFDIQI